MRKKYTVITVRIEQTNHNLKVLKAFNAKVANSKTTKGDWFIEMVYKYFLMLRRDKQLSLFQKIIKRFKK
jgi:hypothetical protein